MLFKSDFEIATESYIPLLQYMLLHWRIGDIARDYLEENTTAVDATAEVKKYSEAISDGTATLNMTPEQRARVRDWIAEYKQMAEINCHLYGSMDDTAWQFESWFNEYEKQHFGI